MHSIGPTLDPTSAQGWSDVSPRLVQRRPKVGPTVAQRCPTSAQIGPTSAQRWPDSHCYFHINHIVYK